jgi:hypothetical protein
MRRVWFVVVVLLMVLVQVGLLPALRPFGVVPNVMLALVALIGLEGTASGALVVAVAGGLAMDVVSGVDFGLQTGMLVLTALVAGLVHRAGWELSGPTVPLALVAAGTVLATVATLLGVAGAVVAWPVGLILGRLGLELVINLSLTLALQPVIRRVIPNRPVSLPPIG